MGVHKATVLGRSMAKRIYLPKICLETTVPAKVKKKSITVYVLYVGERYYGRWQKNVAEELAISMLEP